MHLHWMYTLTLAGCLAGCVLGQNAEAQLINGDFESGTYTFDATGADSLTLGSTDITGWTTVNAELVVIRQPNSYGLTAASGTKSLDLTGYHDGFPYGGVQQVVNTLPGLSYSLSLYVGWAGALPSSVVVSTGGTPTTFTNTGSGGAWEQFTEAFTATGPTNLTITGNTASDGGEYIGLDDVTLTGPAFGTATPEPGSFALLCASGAGLFGLLALRRRRNEKQIA